MHAFHMRATGVPFKKIAALAIQLHQKYKSDIFTGNTAMNLPMQKDEFNLYPIFTKYPENTVSTN
jgi:hypothetical protein